VLVHQIASVKRLGIGDVFPQLTESRTGQRPFLVPQTPVSALLASFTPGSGRNLATFIAGSDSSRGVDHGGLGRGVMTLENM